MPPSEPSTEKKSRKRKRNWMLPSPNDLAAELGVSWRTVMTWIQSGLLPAVDVSCPGRRPRWLISREAIDEFVRRRSAKPRPAPTPRRRKAAVSDETFGF
jgi:excisionase family DNA binding protein